jgi:hypothetical protein
MVARNPSGLILRFENTTFDLQIYKNRDLGNHRHGQIKNLRLPRRRQNENGVSI